MSITKQVLTVALLAGLSTAKFGWNGCPAFSSEAYDSTMGDVTNLRYLRLNYIDSQAKFFMDSVDMVLGWFNTGALLKTSCFKLTVDNPDPIEDDKFVWDSSTYDMMFVNPDATMKPIMPKHVVWDATNKLEVFYWCYGK